MNFFRIQAGEKRKRGGFSLAEATFSIGVLSLGFLSLAPLLTVGLNEARQARNERISSQIAEELIEQAREGTLTPGTLYLDDQADILASPQAATFTVQSSSQTAAQSATLTQLTLRVIPSGAPNGARVYAVVFPTPAQPAH